MAHDEIKKKILLYLRERPNAADTMEGIAQWWVGGEFSGAEVEEVVRQLVDEGVLKKKLSGGTSTYFQTTTKPRSDV